MTGRGGVEVHRRFGRSGRARLWLLLVFLAPAGAARAELADDIRRLWIQASDGAIRHRDLVQPSKDSLIALGSRAVPHLLPYLHTEDAREKHAITDIFKGIGLEAVPALVSVLGTGGEYHTKHTLMALGKIGDSAATSHVVPFLRDPLASVRAQAAETIGKSGGAPAETALFSVLRDSVESVRKSAVVGLGRLAKPSSADSLGAALADSWFGVRYAAATALVKIDSGQVALERLRGMAGRPRALVLHALGTAGTPGAGDVAWRLVGDSDPAVRAEAARIVALGAAETKEFDRIETLLRAETDPVARYHYRTALESRTE
jgi:HEAT repeat protein